MSIEHMTSKIFTVYIYYNIAISQKLGFNNIKCIATNFRGYTTLISKHTYKYIQKK